ncbi:MAG: hypothetical protein IKE17_15555, partial [Clostridia bacterium]|nr:hypothetical protein [Clostridia bacterium]
CKEAFFALVDRLPAAKKAPPAAYTPPRTIKDRGATAPDTPGKLAKGEFVISPINQNLQAPNRDILPQGGRA